MPASSPCLAASKSSLDFRRRKRSWSAACSMCTSETCTRYTCVIKPHISLARTVWSAACSMCTSGTCTRYTCVIKPHINLARTVWSAACSMCTSGTCTRYTCVIKPHINLARTVYVHRIFGGFPAEKPYIHRMYMVPANRIYKCNLATFFGLARTGGVYRIFGDVPACNLPIRARVLGALSKIIGVMVIVQHMSCFYILAVSPGHFYHLYTLHSNSLTWLRCRAGHTAAHVTFLYPSCVTKSLYNSYTLHSNSFTWARCRAGHTAAHVMFLYPSCVTRPLLPLIHLAQQFFNVSKVPRMSYCCTCLGYILAVSHPSCVTKSLYNSYTLHSNSFTWARCRACQLLSFFSLLLFTLTACKLNLTQHALTTVLRTFFTIFYAFSFDYLFICCCVLYNVARRAIHHCTLYCNLIICADRFTHLLCVHCSHKTSLFGLQMPDTAF